VGVTRARERLYLCHAWSRTLFGTTSYNPPSRFLGEIPEDLVHAIEAESPRSRARTWSGRGEADRGRIIGGRPPGADGQPAGGEGSASGGAQRHEPAPVNPGDTVVHERWGEGVVLSIAGAGTDAQATVRFQEVGEKRLLLAYAPLRRV
jgi:DNA helicase-2/ATP-dependent DNA helicase PcrA